jgi:hypothetical protein
MTPERLQRTRFHEKSPSTYAQQRFPKGHAFFRLTLTLSAKGWSASVQWEGMLGISGRGPTQEAAIAQAVEFASTDFGGTVKAD